MVTNEIENKKLVSCIKKLPAEPGVYLFKDADEHILYIGKAKNLKRRGANYVQLFGRDAKVDALFLEADHLDFQVTASELEAMLLEAQLIQSNQPKFNVIFKTGQPFLYLCVTPEGGFRGPVAPEPWRRRKRPCGNLNKKSLNKLPELKLVRNRKQKGTYFGPFLEKGAARMVYDFLVKTFRLKLCKKKIENGCLDYHLGICAGQCRPDFDVVAYQERLALARKALAQGHQAFLDDLMVQIQEHNRREEFERARELHGYYLACQKVFSYLDIKPMSVGRRVGHDVWILADDQRSLHVLIEQQNVLKLKQSFYFLLTPSVDWWDSYVMSYYRTYRPASRILTNVNLPPQTRTLYQKFLRQWHHLEQPVTIIHPTEGHEASLIRYATVAVEQELAKRANLGLALKKFLGLAKEPHTIDCFDISHKQGRAMVGSCVRFTDGKPDKQFFRHFHIKTVKGQDDYASLAEIVGRRYRDGKEVPDLVVIDGGKGQLAAVRKLVPKGVGLMSLAKREETVFADSLPAGKKLDSMSFVGQVLIALRDYTHHFAISFHRKIERSGVR